MDILGSQKQVDEWIKRYGVRYFDILTNTILLSEEVGEVARIIARRYGEQSEKESDKNKDLADELSDLLFVVFSIANQLDINLEKNFQKRLEEKAIRDGKRHLENKKLF